MKGTVKKEHDNTVYLARIGMQARATLSAVNLVSSRDPNDTVNLWYLENLIREERKVFKVYTNIIEKYNTFKTDCSVISRFT